MGKYSCLVLPERLFILPITFIAQITILIIVSRMK